MTEQATPPQDAILKAEGSTSLAAGREKLALFGTRTRRVGGVLAALIGVVSGVIGIWDPLNRNQSSTETLSLGVEPYRQNEVLHYALPITTDLGTFPEGGPWCTLEQQSWLDAHGTRFQRDYTVRVRNTAAEGSSIAVDAIKGEGATRSPDERRVTVRCDTVGETGVVADPARLDPASGSGAFFDDSGQGGGAGQGKPLSPLTYNLRPGESGQMIITAASTQDFDGGLVADVAVGADTATLPFTGLDVVSVAGVESPRSLMFDVIDGRLSCRIVPNAADLGRTSCTVEEYFGAQD